MDIALLSAVSSNYRVNTAASIDVMKLALDSSNTNGANTVALLDSAAPVASDPNLGQNIDVRV
ncbi:YjfB family protein [Clostridium neuense]|uniref:YjfB family protein n=1 Tax=Clostridium neuense TaxID=1728934 RepID=A0ABW8TGK3_9CLOT